jgi:hypothetical protein
MWLMNGTTITSNVLVSMNVPSSWSIVGIGDFNGDGFTDILWRDTGGNVAIWFMNGSTITSISGLGPILRIPGIVISRSRRLRSRFPRDCDHAQHGLLVAEHRRGGEHN